MIRDAVRIPVLVALSPGEFLMGDAVDDKFATDTERPAHQVEIGRAFALGRFPVTVGEYRLFVADHSPEDDAGWPVVNVSWNDATAFCSWLGRETGEPFRLPSEAEWEFACRAGSRASFATGNDLTTDDANFLYAEDGRRVGPGGRTAAGRYRANGFGLEDVHGNVSEWVEDVWHPSYAGAPRDGAPWISGGDSEHRVIRGGAWDYLPRLLRSAWRDSLPCGHRRDNVGFRVALTLAGGPT
jgi:formylglycine-generating enzyme required for sulfatase activity